MLNWCAIGDSLTYLNDHLDETGHYVTRGYLSRICDRLPELALRNIGINGSTTKDWLTVPLPRADVYTVLLGSNDWHQGIEQGTEDDFAAGKPGTILGNLGNLLHRIRKVNPDAKILAATPIARTDFVYLFDAYNNAHGSYAPDHGQELGDIAHAMISACAAQGIPCVNLYDESGITPGNAVKFKRVRTRDGVRDLPYPDYIGLPFDPANDPYPYPPEAQALTYDGLHPSDEGNERLAELLAKSLKSLL